jgi:hypothetical protein
VVAHIKAMAGSQRKRLCMVQFGHVTTKRHEARGEAELLQI